MSRRPRSLADTEHERLPVPERRSCSYDPDGYPRRGPASTGCRPGLARRRRRARSARRSTTSRPASLEAGTARPDRSPPTATCPPRSGPARSGDPPRAYRLAAAQAGTAVPDRRPGDGCSRSSASQRAARDVTVLGDRRGAPQRPGRPRRATPRSPSTCSASTATLVWYLPTLPTSPRAVRPTLADAHAGLGDPVACSCSLVASSPRPSGAADASARSSSRTCRSSCARARRWRAAHGSTSAASARAARARRAADRHASAGSRARCGLAAHRVRRRGRATRSPALHRPDRVRDAATSSIARAPRATPTSSRSPTTLAATRDAAVRDAADDPAATDLCPTDARPTEASPQA